MSNDQPVQQFAAALAPVAEAVNALVVAQARALTELWRQIQPVAQPLIDLYERNPEGFEAMHRELEAERARPTCHCLCDMHRDQGMNCTGIATAQRTIVSPTMGAVHIPMCSYCHDATAVKA